MADDSTNDASIVPTQPPADERLQKIVDKALYAGGNEDAQKLRNSERYLVGRAVARRAHRRADRGMDSRDVLRSLRFDR